MSKSSANAEPSMEEILASIRQIISDDDESVEAELDAASGEEEPAEEEPAEDAKDEAEDVAAKKDAADDVMESAGDETISEADLDALFADPEPAEPEKKEEEPSGDIDAGFDAVAVEPDPEPEPEPEPEPDEEDEGDVLDLGALPDAPADEPFDAPEDLDFAEPPAAPLPEPEPVVHQALPPAAGLLSQETDSAVSAAFANLANTMLSGNARTLEDLVQDMLRPMLKAWLDENLPTMVEKMVREEIERVSRRGPRA